MHKLFDRLQGVISRGWSFFPVGEGKKVPAIAGGFRSAKSGGDGVALFRGHGDRTNIGIALGASGLFAVDIEVADHEWIERMPSTWTQRTPSGGWHFVFRQPATPIPNVPLSVGLAEHVEIRGDGGYILAPGSVVSAENTKSGIEGQYTIVHDVDPIEAPQWLLDRVAECRSKAKEITKPKPRVIVSAVNADWRRRVNELVDTLHGAVEGTRNDTLIRVASSMGRVVAGGFLSDSEACGILEGAVSHWPSPAKNRDCIRRGIGHGSSLEAWYPDDDGPTMSDAEIAEILESAKHVDRSSASSSFAVYDGDAARESLAERVAALSPICADFVQLARDCSVYWQPGFAVGGAVALGSVLGSRRLVWPSQSPLTSSCYVLIIGASGQGKSTATQPISRCLSSWPELIGASKLGPSVQSNIASIKAASESGHGQLWVLDEWHDTLESMLSRKGSAFMAENKGLLLEMATMNTGTYRRRKSVAESRDGENHDVIHVPGFCLMALSATEPLLRVMGQASVDNGLIPRHIAFGPQSSLPRKIRARDIVATPDTLRSAIVEQAKIHKSWATACNGLDLWQGVEINVADSARDIIENFGDRIDEERRQRNSGIADAILARGEEHAIRVAMSLATLAQCGEPVPTINAEVAELACDVVAMSLLDLGSALRDHGGESEYERGLNKVRKAIVQRARVDGWASWSDVVAACRFADSRTLKEMQKRLIEDGTVEASERTSAGRKGLYLRVI